MISRPATTDDIDAIVELRSEAERWLANAGIDQWVPTHHDLARETIARYVADGETWVFDVDGAVAATVALSGPDLDYWTEDDDLDSAIYLYKLIVTRRFAGRGIGAAIFDWAADLAGEQGKQWLRLDCRRDNTKLHDYYQRHGFELVRIETTPRYSTHIRFSGALFQRPVTPTAPGRSTRNAW